MSDKSKTDDNPIFFEAFLFGLVTCDVCAIILDVKDASDPMEIWAKEAAQVANNLGWHTNKNLKPICPDCQKA